MSNLAITVHDVQCAVKVTVNHIISILMMFLKINNFYYINNMLVCLVSLRAVSICLLLHKAANNFTRPLGINSVFSKGHLQILSRQIPYKATDNHC